MRAMGSLVWRIPRVLQGDETKEDHMAPKLDLSRIWYSACWQEYDLSRLKLSGAPFSLSMWSRPDAGGHTSCSGSALH